MPLADVPFSLRILAALAFLAVASGIELVVVGRRAVRWRESLFLVFAAASGALFGFIADGLTVRVSPEYFALGKGLGFDDGLAVRAMQLGARAGTGAGVVVASALLFANRPHPERVAVAGRTLACLLTPPLRYAFAGGITGLLLGSSVLSETLAASRVAGLSESELRTFLAVWSAHAGVYVGALVGTVVSVRRLSALRRAGDQAVV